MKENKSWKERAIEAEANVRELEKDNKEHEECRFHQRNRIYLELEPQIKQLKEENERLKEPKQQEMSNDALLKKIGVAKMTAKIMYDNLHAELIQEIYNDSLARFEQLTKFKEVVDKITIFTTDIRKSGNEKLKFIHKELTNLNK